MNVKAIVARVLFTGVFLAERSWHWEHNSTATFIEYATHVRNCAIAILTDWNTPESTAHNLAWVPEKHGREYDELPKHSRKRLLAFATTAWNECYAADQCATAACTNSESSHYAMIIFEFRMEAHEADIASEPKSEVHGASPGAADDYPRLEDLDRVLAAEMDASAEDEADDGIVEFDSEVEVNGTVDYVTETLQVTRMLQNIKDCVQSQEDPTGAFAFLDGGYFASLLQDCRDVMNTVLDEPQRKRVLHYVVDMYAKCISSDTCFSDECTKSEHSMYQVFLKFMSALKSHDISEKQKIKKELEVALRQRTGPLRFG